MDRSKFKSPEFESSEASASKDNAGQKALHEAQALSGNKSFMAPNNQSELGGFISSLKQLAEEGKLAQSALGYIYQLPDKHAQTIKTDLPVLDGSVRLKSMTFGQHNGPQEGTISFKLTKENGSTTMHDVHGISLEASRKVVLADVTRKTSFISFEIPDDSSKSITAKMKNPIRLEVVRQALNLTGEVIDYELPNLKVQDKKQ